MLSMKFSTYDCTQCANGSLPRPSNMLVLLVDSDDYSTEEPMHILFEEAMHLAANGANVVPNSKQICIQFTPHFEGPLVQDKTKP